MGGYLNRTRRNNYSSCFVLTSCFVSLRSARRIGTESWRWRRLLFRVSNHPLAEPSPVGRGRGVKSVRTPTFHPTVKLNTARRADGARSSASPRGPHRSAAVRHPGPCAALAYDNKRRYGVPNCPGLSVFLSPFFLFFRVFFFFFFLSSRFLSHFRSI